jgi:hypothetical protein
MLHKPTQTADHLSYISNSAIANQASATFWRDILAMARQLGYALKMAVVRKSAVNRKFVSV